MPHAAPDDAAPAPEKPPRPALMDRLGVRLGLVLGLALLPVGVMSMVQSADLLDTARARSEAALAGETLRAVRPKLALVNRAQGTAEALAALPMDGDRACLPYLDRLLAGSQFGFAGQYGTDGRAQCSAGPAPPSLAGSRALAMILTDRRPTLSVLHQPSLALVALHPRLDAGGAVTGVIAVSLQSPVFAPIVSNRVLPQGFALILFDRSGEVLSSSLQPDQIMAALPAGRELSSLTTEDTATFTATSQDGPPRSYSLVRLAEDEVFALGTWPEDRPGLSALHTIPPLILPALMWAISLVAAWLAAEQLVSRHIRRLRSAIIAFAGGNRAIRPLDLSGAPREIRDTADAFERMTAAILRDEAELEDALHGREVLLREVHHRVKNNLQLIASIMNMQVRQTNSDEARTVLRSLQGRMLSLATIHDGLYQTTDLSEINADQLFPGIVDQVVRGALRGGRQVQVTSRIDALKLPLDQAVPLALLLTEALSNAMRYASTADGSTPQLSVTFRMDGTKDALLEVSNPAAARPPVTQELGEGSTGIGTQLLRGFTRQLGGQFHREFSAGMCHVKVWFTVTPRGTSA